MDGPKRCDELGYDARVAKRGLDKLLQYGYVKRRTMPARTGRCAVQFWMLPGVDLLLEEPTPNEEDQDPSMPARGRSKPS